MREKREEEKMRENLLLRSSFPGDSAIDVYRCKRQSSSSRRELRVGTRIGEFRQTPRGRGFFLLGFILSLKIHLMVLFCFPEAVSSPNVLPQDFGIEGGNVLDQMDSPKLYRKCKYFGF